MPTVFYGTDLAHVHDAGFGMFARAAAAELTERCRDKSDSPSFLGKARPRVLDLGCGTGIMAELLGAEGWQVTGVDVSADQLEIARRRAPQNRFIQARADQVSFDEPFNAVCAIGKVLGYEPASDLRRIFGAVKTDLLLFDLAGPDRQVQERRLEGEDWWLEWDGEVRGDVLTRYIRTAGGEETHRLKLWEPDTVEDLLLDAGVHDIERLQSYGELQFPPGLTAWAARPAR